MLKILTEKTGCNLQKAKCKVQNVDIHVLLLSRTFQIFVAGCWDWTDVPFVTHVCISISAELVLCENATNKATFSILWGATCSAEKKKKKFHIRETLNLSTDEDRSTDTILDFYFFHNLNFIYLFIFFFAIKKKIKKGG